MLILKIYILEICFVFHVVVAEYYNIVFIVVPIAFPNPLFYWAGAVGTVGKISAFRPQGPQFDPRLCQDLN